MRIPPAPLPEPNPQKQLVAPVVAGDITTEMDAHVAAGDPHTGYQLESEKGAASGYASLDASSLVPTAQLPVVPATKGGTGLTSIAALIEAILLENGYEIAKGDILTFDGATMVVIPASGVSTGAVFTMGASGIGEWVGP